MKHKNIFVTGASGFVGGAITQKLINICNISAMARSKEAAHKISSLGAKAIYCSLNNISVSDLTGSDVIIHAAACMNPEASKKEYWDTNVKGTKDLLEKSILAGVKKFIYISTESVLFYGQSLNKVDENHPYPIKTPYLYAETKAEAEKKVIQANQINNFNTLVLRPRLIWGPGDKSFFPEIEKAVINNHFYWIDQGKALTSTTHIYNLVYAIQLALESDLGGEVFFISDDEEISFREFIHKYLKIRSIKLPTKSFPSKILRPLSKIIDYVCNIIPISNIPLPISRFEVEFMSLNGTICIDKIKQKLNYSPIISIKQGMEGLAN
jgi:hypothetical protein